jgi:predicted lipid-binding transport protein (Tim44 family)
MSLFNDPTTLILIAVTVFILLRLRSVLGQRNGGERPPLDPRELPGAANRKASNNNVVTLPRKGTKAEGEAEPAMSPAQAAIDAIAKPGTKLNSNLRDIVAADPGFEPRAFLDGAKMAYEMIVTAFADGDRKALKNLLSREVYDGFSAAISEREAKGEQLRSSFVGIKAGEIVSAELQRSEAQLAVRFVSQIISATLDSSGKVIDGDNEQVAEVTDVWTFARDTRSRDPNWKLVATESGS